MKHLPVSLLFVVILSLSTCQQQIDTPLTVSSPAGDIVVDFGLNGDGVPFYTVSHQGEMVLDTSYLGLDFRDQASLRAGLEVREADFSTVDESWELPWGEQRTVVDQHNAMVVHLMETAAPKRAFKVHFKAFDDGIGFRYELLPQQGVDTVIVMDEHTEFLFREDPTVWWIPADYDSYEHLYNESKLSEIDAIERAKTNSLGRSSVPQNAIHTPATLRLANGLHLSIHEANLTNYASTTLKPDPGKRGFVSELVGSERYGYKAKVALPFRSPWRTIQIAENAGDLITSTLILNLNEPNQLGDVSWVKPQKYVGIWWEMHLDVSEWDFASGRHGATTENAKRYIDFAAANGIRGLLVEGWNTGWEHWTDPVKKEDAFDFVTPYPDYDLAEVVRYGREKGVELIMHHETSAAVATYEKHLEAAYDLMQTHGIHAVKTGYVGGIIPAGEYHHGQWMVNHYRRVLEIGAAHQVAINAHEPIKATGIRRTYPNAIAREGVRGQEFNAWASDGGNPPHHIPTIAFTRMLAGPIDFTPGVFELSLKAKPDNQVNTTLAQQLAQYVILYSPIQMACDLPENYAGHPAFQFIRDVAVDWEQSLVLNGEVGDYLTIARQARDSGDWFIGAATNQEARTLSLELSFLDTGKTYAADIYRDAADAHYRDNPQAFEIEGGRSLTAGDILSLQLAPGGGAAVFLRSTDQVD